MELKKYQKAVISDLTEYLALLPTMSATGAFVAFWTAKNVPLEVGEHYRDMLCGVPNVCVKVPTGGGKTYIAASAIAPIFDSLPHTKTRSVVASTRGYGRNSVDKRNSQAESGYNRRREPSCRQRVVKRNADEL
ncbi:hypothetical protein AGMMS49975_15770 [Clostridia bacterium]|nr:hypothetical protein AGMMS49975_15770 [Clostridia bacterium]